MRVAEESRTAAEPFGHSSRGEDENAPARVATASHGVLSQGLV
jgi:hypothetical protein